VTVAHDGAPLVTDSGNDTLWRIAYGGRLPHATMVQWCRPSASGGGDVVQDWPFKNRTASGVQDLDVKKPAAIGPSAMARCN
jgi:hypothetical protein